MHKKEWEGVGDGARIKLRFQVWEDYTSPLLVDFLNTQQWKWSGIIIYNVPEMHENHGPDENMVYFCFNNCVN